MKITHNELKSVNHEWKGSERLSSLLFSAPFHLNNHFTSSKYLVFTVVITVTKSSPGRSLAVEISGQKDFRKKLLLKMAKLLHCIDRALFQPQCHGFKSLQWQLARCPPPPWVVLPNEEKRRFHRLSINEQLLRFGHHVCSKYCVWIRLKQTVSEQP